MAVGIARVVAPRGLVLSADAEKDSHRVGIARKGEEIEVKQLMRTGSGTVRAETSRGWTTVLSRAGMKLLELPEEAESAIPTKANLKNGLPALGRKQPPEAEPRCALRRCQGQRGCICVHVGPYAEQRREPRPASSYGRQRETKMSVDRGQVQPRPTSAPIMGNDVKSDVLSLPPVEPEPEPEPEPESEPAVPAAEGTPVADAVAAPPAEPDLTVRAALREKLAETPFLCHKDALFMHGRAYDGPMTPPRVTWHSTKAPRDDHDTPKWLTASEFRDQPDVAKQKVRKLAAMMRASTKTVIYSGAGISASVIGQAARSGQNKQGWMGGRHRARPTFTHQALGHLVREGWVQSWVQQNHDGLPQKAGVPQEKINEIHGSWYDPSNPVVKYYGDLHDRFEPWMVDDSETADLVLVLGTSLGGLYADQVATDTAKRSRTPGLDAALGSVMINLQQTAEDGKMSLRLFGTSDDMLEMLMVELGYGAEPKFVNPVFQNEDRLLVPYDKNGLRVAPTQSKMWLDLRPGAAVRITPGHNIQGAKQPAFLHIGGKKARKFKGLTRLPGPGHGKVTGRDNEAFCYRMQIEGASMRLGLWWLDAAVRGAVDAIPIVNIDPQMEQ